MIQPYLSWCTFLLNK
ncbi:hypothetical protein AYI68_g8085, partial [Smittium mucronatum]